MKFRFVRAFFSDLIFFPAILFCILNCALVVYGIRMGKGQLEIVFGARDFQEVFSDAGVSDEVKAKLHLIEKIKQFAYDSIGLKKSDNYSTYYDQKGQRLMYVVTASDRFELKAHLWHFPVLGDVPYKGFFDETQANEEFNRLKSLGLDADIGGASGWSTLGWFKDPVLSGMLRMEEGELAELIIHELTHGTIFVKDDVDYNENLAQFVGEQGALWYLRSTYRTDSTALLSYLDGNSDAQRKSAFMITQANFLDSSYRSIAAVKDVKLKLERKKELFELIVQRAETLQLSADSSFARRLESRLSKSGNAVFMQHLRYEGKRADFANEFELSHRNLFRFVNRMKIKYGKSSL